MNKRAAARALVEGGADPDLVASAMGIKSASLDQIARREGWRVTAKRPAAFGQTLDRLIAQLATQLDRFENEDAGGALNKTQLDALLAMARAFDRLMEMRREEEARGRNTKDEAELERARQTVERRVGELAEQRAETIIDHLDRVR